MIEISEILRDNITQDELIPAASLVLTVGVIVAGGYVMSYLVKIEEENVQKTLGAKGLKVGSLRWAQKSKYNFRRFDQNYLPYFCVLT